MTAVQQVRPYDYQPLLATMQPGVVYTTAQLTARSGISAKETLLRLHTAYADGRLSKRETNRVGGTYEWELRL